MFADHIQLLMMRPRDAARRCAGGPRALRSTATSQETAAGLSQGSQCTTSIRGHRLSAGPSALQQPRRELRCARDLRRSGCIQAQRAIGPDMCRASPPAAGTIAPRHGLAATSSVGDCSSGVGGAGVVVARVHETRSGGRHCSRPMPRDARSPARFRSGS